MYKDIIPLIALILLILTFPGVIIYGTYDCYRRSKIEDAKRAQDKLNAKAQLVEEMKKPKSCIRFVDSGREEHVSETYDPYVTSNYYLRNENEYYSVISSSKVAEFALKEAYEEGYITDAEGNTFPTCNLYKLSIEEAK
jgi:hypothetical protein